MKYLFSIFFIAAYLQMNAQIGLSLEKHIDNIENISFPIEKSFHFTKKVENKTTPVPCVYGYKDLAFFCKVEVKLEQAVRFPIKFRLGSVDYVDRLEGKEFGH